MFFRSMFSASLGRIQCIKDIRDALSFYIDAYHVASCLPEANFWQTNWIDKIMSGAETELVVDGWTG